ncbi:hypothetical protein [Shewanella frigidimarina]|uniref:hypothetical protein n=1 Tax=Shewanella frigidimarina TaxID=56812 RepID=UPI003D7A164B
MMSSIEPSKLQEALCKIDVRLKKLAQYSDARKKIDNFKFFLHYLQNNQGKNYYSIHDIKTISNIDSNDELVSIIEFFSSVLDVEYIYLTYDSEIIISKESYEEAVSHRGIPVELRTGKIIEGFEMKRLSFYCIINPQLQV